MIHLKIARVFLGCLVMALTFLTFPMAAAAQTPPEESLPALLSRLQDRDPEVRVKAIRRLAQIKDERAVEPLIETLSHDSDADVRRSAAYALGRLQDPRAVGPLIASLKDEHPDLCINAVFALARMERGEEEDNRVQALTAALAHQNLHVCQAAALGLVLLGDKRSVTPLIRSLQDARFTVRAGAAFSLGFLSDRSAVPALLETLQDDRAAVRRIVVASLGLLGDQRATPPLRRLAAEDPDPGVRSRAFDALQKLTETKK